MICKIDGGMLEHLEQEGYTDRWKCRRCRVVWELAPRGDEDTDKEILTKLLEQKFFEHYRIQQDVDFSRGLHSEHYRPA